MARSQDGLQVGIGFYVVKQFEDQVGRLLVEEISAGKTIEHWDLWATYRQPSRFNISQELVIEYQAASMKLSDFKDGFTTGSTYIVAQCEQNTNP